MQTLKKFLSILTLGLVLCIPCLTLSCDNNDVDPDPFRTPGSFWGAVRLSLLDEQGKDWNQGFDNVNKWAGNVAYINVFDVTLTNSKGKRFRFDTTLFVPADAEAGTAESTFFRFAITGDETHIGEETYTMVIRSKRYMDADQKVVVNFHVKREGGRTECLRIDVNGKEVAVPRKEEMKGWIAENDVVQGLMQRGLPITPIIPLQLKDTPKPAQQ